MDQAIITFWGTVNNQKIKSQNRCHKVYSYEVVRDIKNIWSLLQKMAVAYESEKFYFNKAWR